MYKFTKFKVLYSAFLCVKIHNAVKFHTYVLRIILILSLISFLQTKSSFGGITSCTDCHGQPPAEGATRSAGTGQLGGGQVIGSHSIHVTQLGLACTECHVDNGTNLSHRNGVINFVTIRGGSYSPSASETDLSNTGEPLQDIEDGTGLGTCNNTGCHGVQSPTWGTTTNNPTCYKCHGTQANGNNAPSSARDTPSGNANKVGAHQAHLQAIDNYSSPIQCSECHTVPNAPMDAGHLYDGTNDTTLIQAELNFGTLATNNGAPGTYNYSTQTCDVYCHNEQYFKNAWGTGTAPTWNDSTYLNGTQSDCSKCHGDPPGGGHPSVAQNACSQCHNHVNANGNGFVDPTLHIDGLVEGGDCTGCHNIQQNNRRSVSIDFSMTSHHIKAPWSDINKLSCMACHGDLQSDLGHPDTAPPDPVTQIEDADNAGIYYSINFDNPDISKLEKFCISCHDIDGATRLANKAKSPFSDSGDNNPPPDIGWDSSVSVHSRLGGKCMDCHGNSAAAGTTVDPTYNFHGSESKRLLRYTGWTDSDASGFCFNCHGTPPANGTSYDIKSEFQKNYPHGSKDCKECHNVHQATADNRIKGASGVEFNNGTYSVITISSSSEQYKVCFKCHSSYTSQPPSSAYKGTDYSDFRLDNGTPLPEGDKAIEFDPSNSSYHPVEAQGKNQSMNLDAQLSWAGLSTSSIIKCTDCHNNDILGAGGIIGKAENYTGTEPLGPHGSNNPWLLRASYNRDLTFPRPNQYNENNFALCFSCHDKNKLLGKVWWENGGTAQTNFWDQGKGNYSNLHWVHVVDRKFLCADCHYNVHSNQQANNTQYVDMETGSSYFTPPSDMPTRLVNFAPHVMRSYESWAIKPVWGYHPVTKNRECWLKCHRIDGSDTYMHYVYEGPPSGDYP